MSPPWMSDSFGDSLVEPARRRALEPPDGDEPLTQRTLQASQREIGAPNLHLLAQAQDLVAQLDDERFCATDRRSSSVGAHLRHVIDCYRCFFAGLDAGRIDYDGRQRNPALETERTVAMTALGELVAGFEALPRDLDRPLEVRVDAAAWGAGSLHWQRSTLGRELQFLVSHTVHHFALIALLLRDRGFEPGQAFGVAPSTLEHRGEPATAHAS